MNLHGFQWFGYTWYYNPQSHTSTYCSFQGAHNECYYSTSHLVWKDGKLGLAGSIAYKERYCLEKNKAWHGNGMLLVTREESISIPLVQKFVFCYILIPFSPFLNWILNSFRLHVAYCRLLGPKPTLWSLGSVFKANWLTPFQFPNSKLLKNASDLPIFSNQTTWIKITNFGLDSKCIRFLIEKEWLESG